VDAGAPAPLQPAPGTSTSRGLGVVSHVRWRTEGGNAATAAASVSGAKGRRRRRQEGGQMGRLEHLRPARIAKRMGAGAGEVILPPLRARIRRGTLSWSATTPKVVKMYGWASTAAEKLCELGNVRSGEWLSIIMVKS